MSDYYFFTDWQRGYQEGVKDGRIEAFGAIRRAAAVAREMDVIAEVEQRRNEWVEAGHWNFRADAIRQAIRAAIGPDKA
jgi:hypothetical protein